MPKTPKPIGDDELVSRTRIQEYYGLGWRDIDPLLRGAGIQPVPLHEGRKQPRYLGAAIKRALSQVSQG